MKKISIIAILIVSALSVHAQRFEWAKGFTVSNEYWHILGGITDSLGNLYILGNCDASSVWDGAEYVLPSINKTAKDLPNNVLIAKISTEGEMVWKKVIFANQNGSRPYDIKKIGDSSFACIMDFYGTTDLGYLYFLDTFLVTPTNYPIDVRYFQSAYLAYLVFDFDGNVKEQHFLTITFTDADGNDIVYRPSSSHADTTPWLKGVEDFRFPSFDVDGEGNIYIGRFAVDKCSGAGAYDLTPKDSIRGLKFWVDRRLVGEYRIEGRPSLWFPQIIKFSPHFDTLLGCRYVIQKWNIDLSAVSNQGKMEKRWDFVVKTDNCIYLIETNFYGSGGSKLNETARSYKTIATEMKNVKGAKFVWFTDGAGWKSAARNLEETFDVLDDIYSINDMQNGIMKELFK